MDAKTLRNRAIKTLKLTHSYSELSTVTDFNINTLKSICRRTEDTLPNLTHEQLLSKLHIWDKRASIDDEADRAIAVLTNRDARALKKILHKLDIKQGGELELVVDGLLCSLLGLHLEYH